VFYHSTQQPDFMQTSSNGNALNFTTKSERARTTDDEMMGSTKPEFFGGDTIVLDDENEGNAGGFENWTFTQQEENDPFGMNTAKKNEPGLFESQEPKVDTWNFNDPTGFNEVPASGEGGFETGGFGEVGMSSNGLFGSNAEVPGWGFSTEPSGKGGSSQQTKVTEMKVSADDVIIIGGPESNINQGKTEINGIGGEKKVKRRKLSSNRVVWKDNIIRRESDEKHSQFSISGEALNHELMDEIIGESDESWLAELAKQKRDDKNGKQDDLEHDTIGRCLRMCPIAELIDDKDTMGRPSHPFEVLGANINTKQKIPRDVSMKYQLTHVKEYVKASAGQDLKLQTLRPPEVLVMTTRYLINVVLGQNYIPFGDRYSFVEDRLRSIQKDVQQQVSVFICVVWMVWSCGVCTAFER